MLAELARLERTQAVLRQAASGEPVDVPVAELPPSLQAGGVLPDPRAAEAAEDDREREAGAKARAAMTATWQAEADEAVRALGVTVKVEAFELETHRANADDMAGEWLDTIIYKKMQAATIPTHVVESLRTIASTCGPYDAEKAARAWEATQKAPTAA